MFKAVTPLLKKRERERKRQPGPSSFFFAVEEVFGKGRLTLPSVPSWRPFVLLFRSENTLIRTRECLFRELMGSNRWEMKSLGD